MFGLIHHCGLPVPGPCRIRDKTVNKMDLFLLNPLEPLTKESRTSSGQGALQAVTIGLRGPSPHAS